MENSERDGNTRPPTLLLRNLYAGQEATVRSGQGTTDWLITICKIDSQWEFAVWLQRLRQGLRINLEGWGGEGDGREVQKGGDICIPMADSC